MDEENIDWLVQELNITAERAKERGLTPAEYMAGLYAYLERFKEDHATIDEE